mgnify:CR=1 FL=1
MMIVLISCVKVKSDIVQYGLSIGMTENEFNHTWSCYEGKEKPCGICGTCIDRKEAFRLNNLNIN